MKTKTFLLSLILSCMISLGFSQTDETQESLEKDIRDYVELLETMDFNKMLDYMPPKFFEKFPKEQMVKVMEQSFNNPEVEIGMDNFKITKIHPILELSSGKYALVDYDFLMHMNIKKALEEGETTEDQKEQMGFMKSMLEMQHGEGSVALDEATNSFRINVSTAMYALSEPEFEGWKFIEKKEKVPGLLKSILPQEAIDGLN